MALQPAARSYRSSRRSILAWALRSAGVLTVLCSLVAGEAQAGTNTWTSNGPYGAPVRALAIDPTTRR